MQAKIFEEKRIKMKVEKDIKIILNEEIFEGLEICVKKANPNEACGLVFGDINEIKNTEQFQYHYIGKMFECIESTNKSVVAFLIDNIDKLNEIYHTASVKYKMRLISIFHSHPGGAHPSGIDTDNMKYLDSFNAFKNLIWTIMDASNSELNGFLYYRNEFLQIPLEIKKD